VPDGWRGACIQFQHGTSTCAQTDAMARVDYEEMASRYDLGRDQPAAAREHWREALDPIVDRRRPLLDLGAGTGQWSPLFAQWFEVAVVAVELSQLLRDDRVDPEGRGLLVGGPPTSWTTTELRDPRRLEPCS